MTIIEKYAKLMGIALAERMEWEIAVRPYIETYALIKVQPRGLFSKLIWKLVRLDSEFVPR